MYHSGINVLIKEWYKKITKIQFRKDIKNMSEMQTMSETLFQERFFLDNFNVDRLFNLISRYDYLFLFHINKLALMSENENGIYLAELAEAMNLSIPEVSRMAQRLQDKGYIIWKTDNDKKKTYVKLSGKANELMQKQKDRIVKAYEEITKNISQEELKSMGNTMKKITEIIKNTEE